MHETAKVIKSIKLEVHTIVSICNEQMCKKSDFWYYAITDL